MDPEDNWLDTPLTLEEHQANFLHARSFLPPAGEFPVETSLLLLKPLAIEAGGVFHQGGEIYLDQEEPEWQVLRNFIQGDP